MSMPFQYDCVKCKAKTEHLSTPLWGGRIICTVCHCHVARPRRTSVRLCSPEKIPGLVERHGLWGALVLMSGAARLPGRVSLAVDTVNSVPPCVMASSLMVTP